MPEKKNNNINLSSSSNTSNNANNLELLLENNSSNKEFLDITINKGLYNILNNDNHILQYDLNKLFEESEISNEPTNFAFEIELEQDLIIAFLDQQNLTNVSDLKAIENKFCQLAKMLIVLLESGSEYY
ncbi:14599_t:CDS:2 [Racocetra fulgida]|uniref:14599_t:CDS:1 n=1 Tax=Racocetra fulgida TaxID=60492 RepID=A0A9N8YU00_9GLOM|nr:14599_t:CDS:2 [Racocetra fulgida]